jgi:hypothetical protein
MDKVNIHQIKILNIFTQQHLMASFLERSFCLGANSSGDVQNNQSRSPRTPH